MKRLKLPLLVCLLASSSRVCLATTDSWWQQDGGSITINASAPARITSAYGLRVSGKSFCGIHVSGVFHEDIRFIEGPNAHGRLTVLPTGTPWVPMDLFLGARSLVARYRYTDKPRGSFGVFTAIESPVPERWQVALDRACSGRH